MRPSENIEKLIKKLRVEPRTGISKKNLEDALAAQKKAAGSAYSKPTVWRIIMKSPIIKLAAAAVIIIAVTIGVKNRFYDIGKGYGSPAQLMYAYQRYNNNCSRGG